MEQQRSTYWSVTFFNGEENQELPPKWKLEGQLEDCPETGKPHYQGMLHTPQVRWTQVKKQYPKAHIEVCRDPVALQKYVHKTRTRHQTVDKTVSDIVDHSKITRTKYFEDVLEFIYNNFENEVEAILYLDEDYSFMTKVVNAMIEAGADWAYASMAVQPITRAIWRDYRQSMWESFLENNKHADDNEVQGDKDTDDVQAVTVECVDDEETSDEEASSESEGDTGSESSGSEDDQGSGGD